MQFLFPIFFLESNQLIYFDYRFCVVSKCIQISKELLLLRTFAFLPVEELDECLVCLHSKFSHASMFGLALRPLSEIAVTYVTKIPLVAVYRTFNDVTGYHR